jgi:hypothetical protein
LQLVSILDFGKKQGVQTYHITGGKVELNKIVDSVHEAGGQFAETPKINHVHRGQYILYLKLNLDFAGVGENEQRGTNAFASKSYGKENTC